MHNVNAIVKCLVCGDVNGARDLASEADRAWFVNINLYAAELMPLVTTGKLFTIEELVAFHVSNNFEIDDQFMDHCEAITSEKQANMVFVEIFNFKQWADVNMKSKSVQAYICWTMHILANFIQKHSKDLDKLHDVDLQNEQVAARHYTTAMMYSGAVRDEIGPIIRKNI